MNLERRSETALVRFEETLAPVKLAVSLVRGPEDVASLRPRVRGLIEVCRQAKLGLETRNNVAEQAVRLELAAGKLRREVQRQRGGSKDRGAPLKDFDRELGIQKATGRRWEKLVDVEDKLDAYFAETRTAEREISSADALRRLAPRPEQKPPFLWLDWPEIRKWFEQERTARLLTFVRLGDAA